MADVELRHSTAADRQLKLTALPAGHLGSTSDEGEFFVGSTRTPIGLPVTSPQAPKAGLDVRRLFGFASQGQQNTWTDVGAVAQDGSGMVLSPKPAGSLGVDVVTTGYVLPYELADGGTITIEAVGTYKCGSLAPTILAGLKIGGTSVAPQYEGMLNANGDAAAPTDVLTLTWFEWSSRTIGQNALGGYEALHIAAANMTPGEFQWRLTMKVHALGRWAKWQRGDDDSATKDRNCWVEATLEWGALQYNGGARIGELVAYNNPLGQRTQQWTPFMQRIISAPENGTVRGGIYSFLGEQYLCHAASNTGAQLIAASVTNWADATAYVHGNIREHGSAFWRCVLGHTSVLANDEPGVGPNYTLYWKRIYYDADVSEQMLAEEAPGMGLHWREFFVPAVSKATISGFAAVDWTIGNEIQLELGGPQQVDLGITYGAYGATTAYAAEVGGALAGGSSYVAKSYLYTGSWPRMIAGTSTALWTAAPTGASPGSERAWRLLPATRRDTMRVQHAHGYLYGRRNGVAERRV